MTNYSEKDMLSVAVEIIKKYPSGIDTQNLIKQLRNQLKPDGEDTIILLNRTDDRFSQKVRNLKSHKTLEKKNLATFQDNKFFITNKGSTFLEGKKNELNFNNPEVILSFVPLKYLNFTLRAANAFKNSKCEYVYDLHLLTNFGRNFGGLLKLQNFGRKSLIDVEKFYLDFSKYISSKPLDIEVNKETIINIYKKEKRKIEQFIINHIESKKNDSQNAYIPTANIPKAKSYSYETNSKVNELEIKTSYIEEILKAYFQIAKIKTDREIKILNERIFGNKTLEELGKEYGVTRERIRQQEEKIIKKIQKSLTIRDCLNKISKVIGKTVFENEKNIYKKLFHLNLVKGEIKISGIKKLLKMFKFKQSEQIQKIRENYYVFESSYYRSIMMSSISKYIRDENSKYGIINISLLHKDLQRRNFLMGKNNLLSLIKVSRNSLIINNEYYLISYKNKTNLLIGAIHSTLSVTNKIEISELITCLKQYRRINNFSPPADVLKIICEYIGYKINENFVINDNYSENNSYLMGVRKKLFKMFLNNGRIMTYEQILNDHSKYGLNINSTNVLIYENLFSLPRKGIFVLAGTEVSDEDLDILENNRKNLLKELSQDTNFKYDKKGNIVIQFNKLSLQKGPMWLSPAFVKEIPTGDYEIDLNNKKDKLKIFSSRIWTSIESRDHIKKSNSEIITLKLDLIGKKAFIIDDEE